MKTKMKVAAATLVASLTLGAAVPSGAAPADDERFVGEAYIALVGREADSAGLDYWTGRLEAGASRTAVATSLALSSEALRRRWVARPYFEWLGHAPDAAGRAYWADRIAGGGRLVDLEVAVLGSAESYGLGGSTGAGYVDRLYELLLHRPAGEGEVAYWTGRLSSGTTRGRVAALILGSPEAEGLQVAQAWKQVDRQTPTPEQRAASVALLDATRDIRRLMVSIVLEVFGDEAPPANQAPTAVLTADETEGAEDLEVTFDALGSSDADGTIESYLIDFGDGSPTTDVATPTHTYTEPGTYIAQLTVTDDGEATATDTVTITVTANQAPTAVITGETFGADPFTTTLSGEQSTDPDGMIVSYQWITETGTVVSTDRDLEITFPGPGRFGLYLFVTDDDGDATYDYVVVEVTEPG
jgi:PKD repeat protein